MIDDNLKDIAEENTHIEEIQGVENNIKNDKLRKDKMESNMKDLSK